jgi:hypothetical protein
MSILSIKECGTNKSEGKNFIQSQQVPPEVGIHLPYYTTSNPRSHESSR